MFLKAYHASSRDAPRSALRRHPARLVLLLAAALALGACKEMSPLEVARGFWDAAAKDDQAAMRRYVAPGTWPPEQQHAHLLAVGGARFGRIVIDGDRASIDTTVSVRGDRPLDVPLETRLVRDDGAWRVDYHATVAPLAADGALARFLQELRRSGERLARALDESADGLRRSLPGLDRDLRGIEEELRHRIPELRERIEEFSRRLEDALRPPPARKPIRDPI